MMIRRGILPTAGASLALLPFSSLAHHPLDEVYERDSSITLTGTVTQIEWVNPHAILRLRVEDGEGSDVEWLVEMDPPGALMQRGWTRDSITAGQIVTVEGFRALNGESRTEAKTITLSSGAALVASTDTSWNWRRADNIDHRSFEQR